MANTTFERLREIIAEQLGVEKDKITPESSFTEDLNADSLDMVDLVMTIEEKFELGEINDEDSRGIQTVQDAVNYIDDKLS